MAITLPNPTPDYVSNGEALNETVLNRPVEDVQANVVAVNNAMTAGYKHTQSTGSSSWTVNHALDTEDVIVQVYDDSGNMIQPDEISITDSNNVSVSFSSNQTGKAIVVGI